LRAPARLRMRVDCTYFPPFEKARGKRFSTTWQRLCARLIEPKITTTKGAAPGVSLATYRGNHRTLANVERVFAVGLDLDHDVPPWEDVVHLFANSTSLVHSTWSSTPENPRARVFLLLSRPVSAEEYRRVYSAVVGRAEGLGLVVDRAASDPSRFWFLPSIPDSLEALNDELERKNIPAAASLPKFVHALGLTGRPVNVDWALATVPEQAPPVAPPLPRSDDDHGDVVERARRWLSVRDPAIEGSGGDKHTFETAVCIVRGFDLDRETSFSLLAEWNRGCKPPWSERDLRRKIETAERSNAERGFLRDARRAS